MAPDDPERDLLRRRARALARPMDRTDDGADLDLLIFSVSGERFALALDAVDAVAPIAGLTWIPGVPPWIRGVVNHKGSLCCAIDLNLLAGHSGGVFDFFYVVFTSGERGSVGLLAAGITIERHPQSDFAANASPDRYVRGVSPSLVSLLDPGELLADPRLLVRQGASRG